MRKAAVALLVLVARAAFAADGPSFAGYLRFQVPPDTEIKWAAATNQLPAALWIYKVVPQHFSAAAVSNLVALGALTLRDERRRHGGFSNTNEDPLVFCNKQQTRTLTVVPSQGWIKYHDEYAPANHYNKTNHTWEPVRDLPGGKRLEDGALKFVEQFGIHRCDLVTKPSSTNLLTFGIKRTRTYFDRERGREVKDEEFYRGVFFVRRIAGIGFAGIGTGAGCEVCFGNDAKIADFELVWRNMQPGEQRSVASPAEIVKYVRAGGAVMTHRDSVNPRDVKKLTITEVVPFYMGATGEEIQSLVYPFAQIEAIASLGSTNLNVQLYCPILTQRASAQK
ncbi:MAG TPA: hypothetical protein VG146_14805 [Verrucomicrobiae bacterium]|nr:hypothetical protein [Verrucomicrobiae bacterium]